jgi:hypothetical protein
MPRRVSGGVASREGGARQKFVKSFTPLRAPKARVLPRKGGAK